MFKIDITLSGNPRNKRGYSENGPRWEGDKVDIMFPKDVQTENNTEEL